jgi:hypothetical protein
MTTAVGSSLWRKYVGRRTRAGWSEPPQYGCDRVLIYEVVSGFDMIVVYYFIDERKLKRAFISET